MFPSGPEAVPSDEVPHTLTDFAALVRLDPEIASAFWEHLDLDPLLDMEVALDIQPSLLDESISSFVTDKELSVGVAGRLSLIFKKLRAALVPAATVDKMAPPPEGGPSSSVHRGKISAVLDQSDDTPFDRLDPAQRAVLRNNHIAATGGPAPVEREPSPDQLAAMVARLARGDSPYADFAVFQPHGRRLAKFRLFEAQVFVDGQLKSRQLKGPSNFTAWKACWDVFRATLVSLGTVSPAALDAYERGISQLNEFHPQHWGVVYCADELLRSEVWQSVYDGLVDAKTLPEDHPWDFVMRVTTYGGPLATPAMVHWWKTHVDAPIQHSGAPMAFLQRLEGTHLLPTPSGMASSSDAPPYAAADRNQPRDKKSKNKNNNKNTGPYTHANSHFDNSKGSGKGKGGKDSKGKGKGGKYGHGAKGSTK